MSGRGIAALLAGFGTGYLKQQQRNQDQERQGKLDQLAVNADTRAAETHANTVAINGINLKNAQQQVDDQLELRGAMGGMAGVDRTDERFPQYAKAVSDTLMKQGKLEQAKAFQGFVDSEDGKIYTKAWDAAAKATAAGNYDAAIPHLQQLYGQFPDGKSADIKPLGDGRYSVTLKNEVDGSPVRTETLDAKKLAELGVYTLAPEKRAQFFLDKGLAETKADAAARIAGFHEDSRDARQQKGLDAMAERQDKQLEAMARLAAGRDGKITNTQEANNQEIILARKRLTGMDMNDVKAKIQQFLPNGRENPQFDPTVSQAYRTANQRMVGHDPEFDRLTENAQPLKQPSTPAEKFKADPAMKGMVMGKPTPNGWEVRNGNGQLIGHWK